MGVLHNTSHRPQKGQWGVLAKSCPSSLHAMCGATPMLAAFCSPKYFKKVKISPSAAMKMVSVDTINSITSTCIRPGCGWAIGWPFFFPECVPYHHIRSNSLNSRAGASPNKNPSSLCGTPYRCSQVYFVYIYIPTTSWV